MSLVPPQVYLKVTNLHRIGLASARPAATDVVAGTLYYSTDTAILERSDGATWSAYGGGSTGVSYTPIWTGTTTNPTLGNGTLTGSYIRVSKIVHYRIDLTVGSTTTPATGIWVF